VSEQTESLPQVKEKASNRGLTLFVCLLMAVIGGAGGYLYLQQLKMGINISERLEKQREDLTSLNEASAKKVAVLNSRLTEQGKELARAKENVVRLQQNLATISGASQKDWALAEVEYLLRLANQRLLIDKDPSSAAGIVNSADKLLFGLDDPALNYVREAIAKDIAALNSVGRLDSTGMYLRLVALGFEVEKLEQLEKGMGELPPVLNETESSDENKGETFSDKLIAIIERYIRVYDRKQVVEPMLPPEQEFYLKQNLRLMLEQAQLALLRGEQSLYRSSLQKVLVWLDLNYKNNDISDAIKLAINDVIDMKIQLEIPDISGSLNAIRTYIVNQHGINP